MTNKILLPAASLIISFQLLAQPDDNAGRTDVKTGFGLGGVPAIAYDQDKGFLYGLILNFYQYGDGSRYPRYDHSLYLEGSRTTRGSGKYQLIYDSDRLLTGMRTAFELSYLTEQALDFYGFNGNKAYYNYALMNDESDDYISRMYYRLDRKMLRLRTDFTGDIAGNRLKWFAGMEFYDIKMDTVDTKRLNDKAKSEAGKLPYVGGGLFGSYAYEWNILPPDQIHGGRHTLLKAGLIYDTRDNEPNPMKGIWTEVQLILAPQFLSDKSQGYTRLALTHRQYFTIIPRDLNFTYRLSYQTKLTGEMPYYMLPFVFNSPPNYTRDGPGGSNNIRGVLRNRLAGEGFMYGNLELRWKFVHFRLLGQNIYFALAGLLDGGMVTSDYKIDLTDVPASAKGQPGLGLFTDDEELHLGSGAGFHLALNENFVITVDYGLPLNVQDNHKGALYINLDFLY